MRASVFALKGNFCSCGSDRELHFYENSYAVCENGLCSGIYPVLPEQYRGIQVEDYGNALIIPGFTDLHLHAPQYTYRGTGMDLELLQWLNTYTFPEEAAYGDLEYAEKAYRIFAEDLKRSATTRACIFATIHVEATEKLMDLLDETGVRAFVGKVNMDRNGGRNPDGSILYQEKDAEASAEQTLRWLRETEGRYRNIRPILTPRFTPSCSDELMSMLGKIQKEWKLPMQSHLSENMDEIRWVQELCPKTRFYGEAYDEFGLFGGDAPTVMAHCVYSPEEEVRLMKERGVFIAHCPESNMNVSTGIAPVRRYLDEGLSVGLGSDVAGGSRLNINYAIVQAIQASKIRHRLVDSSLKPLTLADAFYMATRGGGAFFGKVGAFEKGYEFDAVVLDDLRLATPKRLSMENRLERLMYLSDERDIRAKYAAGERIF